jgi:hypothetical protein
MTSPAAAAGCARGVGAGRGGGGRLPGYEQEAAAVEGGEDEEKEAERENVRGGKAARRTRANNSPQTKCCSPFRTQIKQDRVRRGGRSAWHLAGAKQNRAGLARRGRSSIGPCAVLLAQLLAVANQDRDLLGGRHGHAKPDPRSILIDRGLGVGRSAVLLGALATPAK